MRILLTTLLAIALAACGGQAEEGAEDAVPETGLTQEQIENGIGPIRTVSLEEIDEDLAEQGEEIFKLKCSACHKMDERYVGPALGDVTERRAPAYIMNMMLNPEEMVQKHPEVKALLAQYLTPMPNQQLTEADARAVLEYLRDEKEDHE
jgi:mono/diheme cytochrome c family protein